MISLAVVAFALKKQAMTIYINSEKVNYIYRFRCIFHWNIIYEDVQRQPSVSGADMYPQQNVDKEVY